MQPANEPMKKCSTLLIRKYKLKAHGNVIPHLLKWQIKNKTLVTLNVHKDAVATGTSGLLLMGVK